MCLIKAYTMIIEKKMTYEYIVYGRNCVEKIMKFKES